MDPTSSKRRKLSPETSLHDASRTSLPLPRASFMSPTKSSLSRFNPKVLSKSNEYDSRRNSEDRPSSSPRKLNPIALRTSSARKNTRLSASPTRAPSSSPSRQPRSEGNLSAAPRRGSFTTSGSGHAIGTALGAAQSIPVTEGSSSAAREGNGTERSLVEEEKLAQVVRRSARATRGNRLSWVRAEEEQAQEQQEPELPPTPEQLGLEQRAERPRGLWSSSPSGRLEKRRREEGVGVGSSPLKPRDGPQADDNLKQKEVEERAQIRLPNINEIQTQAEEDPGLAQRKDTIEQLSAQLESLRKDVSLLEDEVRRSQSAIQDPQLRGRISPDKIIALLTTTNPSNAPLAPPPKGPSLASRLASFLPFSMRPALQQKSSIGEEDPNLAPIFSHRPLTPADPLPHLRLFTPFSITSADTLIIPSDTNAPLLRQQEVTLSASLSLLALKLRLISNLQTETLESVSLLSISPWADFELGTWIRQEAAPAGDAGSISWAAARYLEVSRARGECWAKCLRKWPGLLRRHQPALGSKLDSPHHTAAAENDAEAELDKVTVFACRKRPSLSFSPAKMASKVPHLMVSWRIAFDWVGEPRSEVRCEASWPKRWVATDERRSLGTLGKAFDMLVPRVGVLGAVEGVVGMVFGQNG